MTRKEYETETCTFSKREYLYCTEILKVNEDHINVCCLDSETYRLYFIEGRRASNVLSIEIASDEYDRIESDPENDFTKFQAVAKLFGKETEPQKSYRVYYK